MILLEKISCIFVVVEPLCQEINSKACPHECTIMCTKIETPCFGGVWIYEILAETINYLRCWS